MELVVTDDDDEVLAQRQLTVQEFNSIRDEAASDEPTELAAAIERIWAARN